MQKKTTSKMAVIQCTAFPMLLYPIPLCSVPVFYVVTSILQFSNFAGVGSTFEVCIFAKVALPILGNRKWHGLWLVSVA
jgi:hypothetical protein